MYNLLPSNKKNSVRREYRARLLLGLFLMLFVTGVVSLLSILPSYFLSDVQVSGAKAELLNIQDINTKSGANTLSKTLSETRGILDMMGPIQTNISPSSYVGAILEHKTPAIKIRSITISSNTKKIANISGVADTRASLVSFVGALRGDDMVAGVDLPVSDLASAKDIVFSLSVELKTPKL